MNYLRKVHCLNHLRKVQFLIYYYLSFLILLLLSLSICTNLENICRHSESSLLQLTKDNTSPTPTSKHEDFVQDTHIISPMGSERGSCYTLTMEPPTTQQQQSAACKTMSVRQLAGTVSLQAKPFPLC